LSIFRKSYFEDIGLKTFFEFSVARKLLSSNKWFILLKKSGGMTVADGFEYLRIWMIISIFSYFFAGLTFLFGQNFLLGQINAMSNMLFKGKYPLIPASSERFWLVLTSSMMLMLTVLCIFAAVDPEKYLSMVVIILISKACSTGLYIWFFIKDKYFAYIVGALTDGPLFLVTLVFFIWAAVS
jgi:hypothetical protein